jgi:hypothetical protein
MPTQAHVLPLAVLAAMVVTACGGSSRTSAPARPTPAAGGSGAVGALLWVQRFGQGGQAPGSVEVSPDGSTAYVTGTGGTLAYQTGTGAQRWLAQTSAFQGSGGSTPAPSAALSPDGSRLYVAGTSGRIGSPSPSSPKGDYVVLAYDTASGKQLWTRSYDGPAKGEDSARAVAVSPSGDTVYVHGISQGTGTGADYATVAYTATNGTQRWVSRYDGPGEEGLFGAAPQSLAVSRDGRTVLVTGSSKGSTSGTDWATVAYDAASGAKRWASRYDGPAHSDDLAGALAVTSDGSTVVVTGASTGSTAADATTVGYRVSNGAQVWVQRHDGPAHRNDGTGAIVVTPRGDAVVVTGTSEGAGPDQEDWVTLAYAPATGKPLWTAAYDGPTHGDDNAAALAASRDGTRLYVTGWATANGSSRAVATVAYDAGGTRQWAQVSTGGAGDGQGRAVAVTTTGTVVVAGSTSEGWTTLAYRG